MMQVFKTLSNAANRLRRHQQIVNYLHTGHPNKLSSLHDERLLSSTDNAQLNNSSETFKNDARVSSQRGKNEGELIQDLLSNIVYQDGRSIYSTLLEISKVQALNPVSKNKLAKLFFK